MKVELEWTGKQVLFQGIWHSVWQGKTHDGSRATFLVSLWSLDHYGTGGSWTENLYHGALPPDDTSVADAIRLAKE